MRTFVSQNNIDKPDNTNLNRNVVDGIDGGICGDVTVETQNFASLPINPINPTNPTISSTQTNPTTTTGNKFGPQSKNPALIIRGFNPVFTIKISATMNRFNRYQITSQTTRRNGRTINFTIKRDCGLLVVILNTLLYFAQTLD